MNLTDYPTPRTRAKSIRVCQNWSNQGDHVREVVFAEDYAKLEREAAAWKEVAEAIHSACNLDELQAAHEAFDALKSQLTQP